MNKEKHNCETCGRFSSTLTIYKEKWLCSFCLPLAKCEQVVIVEPRHTCVNCGKRLHRTSKFYEGKYCKPCFERLEFLKVKQKPEQKTFTKRISKPKNECVLEGVNGW